MYSECTCYFDSWYDKNVFDCHNQGLLELPEQLQPGTKWVKLNRNNITKICGSVNQLKTVSRIELAHNNIDVICSESMEQLTSISMHYIDLSYNNMSYLPETIENASNSTQLLIGNNPYKCNCDMLWMAKWLLGSNTAHIPDLGEAICTSGTEIGTQIYKVTDSSLDCIPLPTALICGASFGVVAMVVCLFVLYRYLDRIKFQIFLRFNVRVNEDQAEDVDEMNFDALVAYK